MEKVNINREKNTENCIALIDYENCSNLTEIPLNIYTELIIFSGEKQNNVALPVSAFPEAVKLTLRHVSETSRNNVDFHLVLELGQYVYRYGSEKEYHIVSADKGYDGIVRTLQMRGIRCRRVSPDKVLSAKIAVPDMDIVIRWTNKIQQTAREVRGFAPIFPDTCYHLTHYWLAAVDIPVASDNLVHYADAIRYNARTPLQGSLLPLTRLVWA
ncbi:hypothetical protein ECMP0215527_0397 [Escherichia coli MP021552.7]|nr:hypothetical protein ECMP0215527_0397 [Escherichia coli MP021552.7]